MPQATIYDATTFILDGVDIPVDMAPTWWSVIAVAFGAVVTLAAAPLLQEHHLPLFVSSLFVYVLLTVSLLLRPLIGI